MIKERIKERIKEYLESNEGNSDLSGDQYNWIDIDLISEKIMQIVCKEIEYQENIEAQGMQFSTMR